jgi:hypothetical protein
MLRTSARNSAHFSAIAQNHPTTDIFLVLQSMQRKARCPVTRFFIATYALLLLTSAASAQFQSRDWSLSLAGTGSNDKNGNNRAFGAAVELGYFLNPHVELGLRQTIAYSDFEGSTATSGSTHVALDYHIPIAWHDRVQLFVGGNGGFDYSDINSDAFEIAPEAGLKVFVNSTTFIALTVEDEFFTNNNSNGFGTGDSQFVYRLGIGFRF